MSPLSQRVQRLSRRILPKALVVGALALPCLALATPPPWAPAHGWRKKNDPTYPGYSGHHWEYDYGVRSGHCDRAEIGAVLGGVAGAVIGSEVAKGDNRVIAMVVGTVIGAAIGSEIGRHMDKTDRYCVGHSLELAKAGQTVSWTNPTTRVSYQVTPLDRGVSGEGCRKFRLVATGGFGLSEGRSTACAGPDGVWNLDPNARMTRR
jgi:surface antigen